MVRRVGVDEALLADGKKKRRRTRQREFSLVEGERRDVCFNSQSVDDHSGGRGLDFNGRVGEGVRGSVDGDENVPVRSSNSILFLGLDGDLDPSEEVSSRSSDSEEEKEDGGNEGEVDSDLDRGLRDRRERGEKSGMNFGDASGVEEEERERRTNEDGDDDGGEEDHELERRSDPESVGSSRRDDQIGDGLKRERKKRDAMISFRILNLSSKGLAELT